MTVFFTSDTHFGHERIITSCARPFETVDEMDEALITRWNERVGANDTVYHLGDFAYWNVLSASHYLERLNGKIHLIIGNHDKHTLEDTSVRFVSTSLIREVQIGKQWIVLCHYPMREWHGSYRKAWHLFGHVHGRLDHEPLGFSLDVGVDAHHFLPWSMDEIATAFEGRVNPFSGSRKPRISTV